MPNINGFFINILDHSVFKSLWRRRFPNFLEQLIFCGNIRRDWVSCLSRLLSGLRCKTAQRGVIVPDSDDYVASLQKRPKETVRALLAGLGCWGATPTPWSLLSGSEGKCLWLRCWTPFRERLWVLPESPQACLLNLSGRICASIRGRLVEPGSDLMALNEADNGTEAHRVVRVPETWLRGCSGHVPRSTLSWQGHVTPLPPPGGGSVSGLWERVAGKAVKVLAAPF